MSNPFFSIISSAIRTENYKRFYNSFSQNSKTPFEIIFVGSHPPTEFIGEHFNYIYSTVKPSQCVEIGARKSKGKYIISTNDDHVFSDNILDELYHEISTTDTDHYLVSFTERPSYRIGSTPKEPKILKTQNYHGLEFGECACFPRDIWMKLGGMDKKFIYSFYDIDLQFRCFEYGLHLKLLTHIYFREILPATNESNNQLFQKYKKYHNSLLDFLWLGPNFKVRKKRLYPVESFDNYNILTISQGEKGQWE